MTSFKEQAQTAAGGIENANGEYEQRYCRAALLEQFEAVGKA